MKEEETRRKLATELAIEDQKAYELQGGVLVLCGNLLKTINDDFVTHKEGDGDRKPEPASKLRTRINAGELRQISETIDKAHKGQRLAVGADDEKPTSTVIVNTDIRAQLRQAVVDGILPKANVPALNGGSDGKKVDPSGNGGKRAGGNGKS
jgi:hypothetical protein